MPAFLTRMPAGIPGNLSRASQATVEAAQVDATNPATSYGVPVAIDATSKNARKVLAADTVASVFGFLVRSYVTNSSNDALGTSTPPTSGFVSVMKRGYMNVKVNNGTPSKNSPVYIRTVANGGNTIIGGVEAASDSTNSFVLTGAFFTGPMDANGNAEIAYNL